MKGLMVSVLRNAELGDCTNRGASSTINSFVLLKNGAPNFGPFEPRGGMPALYLARWYGRVIACPENLEEVYPKKHNKREDCSIEYLGAWMFGGNYVDSSDARFREVNDYPIHIYDRREP